MGARGHRQLGTQGQCRGDLPIDLSVIGIVDQVVTQDQVTYRK
jgi:microcompartment protein CcmK/EutM